ncbi:MAG: HEAT repeat domain-containing protein [Candidatus Gygaella obscura]|nr:HEAT repeat domain-containing protein [Candidatus Gygaella obscura]
MQPNYDRVIILGLYAKQWKERLDIREMLWHRAWQLFSNVGEVTLTDILSTGLSAWKELVGEDNIVEIPEGDIVAYQVSIKRNNHDNGSSNDVFIDVEEKVFNNRIRHWELLDGGIPLLDPEIYRGDNGGFKKTTFSLTSYLASSMLLLNSIFMDGCSISSVDMQQYKSQQVQIPQNELAQYSAAINQCLAQRNYHLAMRYYVELYSKHRDLFSQISFKSQASKDIMVDEIIASKANLGKESDLDPEGILEAMDVTSEEIIKSHERLLRRDNFLVAFCSARVLAKLGDYSCRDILIKGMDRDFNLGQIYRLNNIKPEDQEKIEDYIAMAAASYLAEIADTAAEGYFIRVLTDKSHDLNYRINALNCLANYPGNFSNEALMEVVYDNSVKIRSGSIVLLGERMEIRAKDIFIIGLQSGIEEVIQASAVSAAFIEDTRAISHIGELLYSNISEDTKLTLISALVRLGTKKALHILMAFSKLSQGKLQESALAAIANFDEPEAKHILVTALEEDRASLRSIAAESLSIYLEDDRTLFNKINFLLKTDTSDEVRASCIASLSTVGIKEAEDIIYNYSYDSNWRIRKEAALGLDRYVDKKAIDRISDLMYDVNEKVRQAATIAAANKLEDNPILRIDMEVKLEDPSKKIRSIAAMVLAPHLDKYPQFNTNIRRILVDSDIQAKAGILLAIAQSNTEVAASVIKPFLRSNEPLLKHTAITSLASMDNVNISQLLTGFVKDNDWHIRQAAALALGNSSDWNNVGHLRNLMRDNNPFVKAAAIGSFANLPNAPVNELVPFLQDKSWQVRHKTIEVISPKIPEMPDLSKTLSRLARFDDSSLVRSEALLSLAPISQPQVIDVANNNLRSNDWLLRRNSALALGSSNSPLTITPLVNILRDPHPMVRAAAIQSLGPKMTKYPTISNYVQPLLNDSNWRVRRSTVETIGNFSRTNFKNVIIPKLQDPSPEVRFSSVQSLAKFNTLDVTRALIPTLKDPSLYVHKMAKMALAKQLVLHPDFERIFPELKELKPFIDELKSTAGAIVHVYEGINPKYEFKARQGFNIGWHHVYRSDNWSQDLQLRKSLELINILSAGKVEFREGNWSGNPSSSQNDIHRIGEDLYRSYQDAKRTNRKFILIGNSAFNKMGPKSFSYIKQKYNNPVIMADRYIGTGYPAVGFIGINIDSVKEMSIEKPIIVGSQGDPVFLIPQIFTNEKYFKYRMYSEVRHAGTKGYFDHPDSVSTIINFSGFVAPNISKTQQYLDIFNRKINVLYEFSEFKQKFETQNSLPKNTFSEYNFNSIKPVITHRPGPFYKTYKGNIPIVRQPVPNFAPSMPKTIYEPVKQFEVPKKFRSGTNFKSYTPSIYNVPTYTPPIVPKMPEPSPPPIYKLPSFNRRR